jgi:hypothetical protein
MGHSPSAAARFLGIYNSSKASEERATVGKWLITFMNPLHVLYI